MSTRSENWVVSCLALAKVVPTHARNIERVDPLTHALQSTNRAKKAKTFNGTFTKFNRSIL